jgi:hypothetical protein
VQGYDEGKAAGEARVAELVTHVSNARKAAAEHAAEERNLYARLVNGPLMRETCGGTIVRLDGDSVLLEASVKGFDIGDRVRLVKV